MIEFDPQKDARNIALRGISLAAAETLLTGFTVEWTDERRDYGETRIIAIGEVGGLEYVCVYTRRGAAADFASQSQQEGTRCLLESKSRRLNRQPGTSRIGRR